MSEQTEIVNVAITEDTIGSTLPGFGTPLVLSHNATFPDPSRYYGSTVEAAVDWPTTSPEYRTIKAALSQSPHVEQVGVGRATSKPTQQYTVGVVTVRNSDQLSYRINVDGQGVTATQVTFTSDSSATIAEIHNGLVTALNAVTGANFVAAFAPVTSFTHTFTASNPSTLTVTGHGLHTGDGPFQLTNSGGALPTGLATVTNYWIIAIDVNTFSLADSLAHALAGTAVTFSTNGTGTQTIASVTGTGTPTSPFTVTGLAPGNWFALQVTDVTALSNKQTHADPGITADLDALLTQDNTWYCLLTLYNSKAYVLAASSWVEAQTKIYVADDCNTDSITVVVGSGTDAGATLHSLAPRRTALSYYSNPASMLSASAAGRTLCIEPGGETWMFKTLSGMLPDKLSTTHRNNLRARAQGWYQTVAGRNITQEGHTSNGDFLDVIRGLDWLVNDMTTALFETLADNDKVGLDDDGITLLENDIVASLDRAVDRKILRAKPRPQVFVPKAADVDDNDRALRTIPDITFSAQLDGAVQKLIVNGVVSV